MSRSNPTDHLANPAIRYFEWNGEHGAVRYYDKDTKKNVDVPLPFTFLLLDELASVRGWDDASASSIYSNEVKDTRTEILVVKAFKGGTRAEGLYRDIKDRVNAMGASYNADCYIAFKVTDKEFAIGQLRLKGAALNAWVEFRKTIRNELYSHALEINGFTEGKKGRIVYRVPTFKARSIARETNEAATELDKELQTFLKAYFARKTGDRAQPEQAEAQPSRERGDGHDEIGQPITVDDIPF